MREWAECFWERVLTSVKEYDIIMAKQYVAPEIEIVEVDANDGNRYSLPYGIYREGFIKIALNKTDSGDVKKVEEQIKNGFWSQASSENYKYQTLVHEYGHAIEYNVCSMLGVDEEIDREISALLQKAYTDYRVAAQFKKKSKELITSIRKKNFYDKVFPEIFKRANAIDNSIAIPNKILKKGYETAPRISGYGATSWAEYFAESFANGMCGKPTAIGQATVDVVKSIYKGDFKW